MLRPNSQPDRLQSWLPTLKLVNQLKSRLTWFMTKFICWPALKLRGQLVPWLRARTMPHSMSVLHAVAIALQSWCLIKLIKPRSPSPELWLSTRNNQQWHFCGDCRRVTDPAKYVLYSSNSSPALCWIKLSLLYLLCCLSPSSTEQRALTHPLHWEVMFLFSKWETYPLLC